MGADKDQVIKWQIEKSPKVNFLFISLGSKDLVPRCLLAWRQENIDNRCSAMHDNDKELHCGANNLDNIYKSGVFGQSESELRIQVNTAGKQNQNSLIRGKFVVILGRRRKEIALVALAQRKKEEEVGGSPSTF